MCPGADEPVVELYRMSVYAKLPSILPRVPITQFDPAWTLDLEPWTDENHVTSPTQWRASSAIPVAGDGWIPQTRRGREKPSVVANVIDILT